MKCYYAHSKNLYGTSQEARDIKLLEELGFEVLNPNLPEHQAKCMAGQFGEMNYFELLVRSCNVLAFRALPHGEIGAGVALEIRVALSLSGGMPIIELPCGLTKRMIGVEETREFLRDVGQR